MILYQSVGPNPRVAIMYAAEKGIALPRAFVDIIEGENRRDEYLAKNPAGGTPCLELDDGSVIAESIAICEYLEELHPSPPLVGRSELLFGDPSCILHLERSRIPLRPGHHHHPILI